MQQVQKAKAKTKKLRITVKNVTLFCALENVSSYSIRVQVTNNYSDFVELTFVHFN